MPVLVRELESIRDSIERPVYFSVLNHLFKKLRISSSTKIRMLGSEEKAYQPGSAFGGLVHENAWPADEYMTVDVSDQPDEDVVLSTLVKRPGVPYVFADTAARTTIKPVYAMHIAKMTIRYTAPDEASAKQWINMMRVRASQYDNVNLHDLDYHYCIPQNILRILKLSYDAGKAYAQSNETFPSYLKKYFIRNLTTLVSANAEHKELAIVERQSRVLGNYDFNVVPEKGERDADTIRWNISFDYEFRYKKPLALVVKYPLVMFNKALPDKYISKNAGLNPVEYFKAIGDIEQGMYPLRSDVIALRAYGNKGLMLPEYDDFMPDTVVESSIRVFSALTTVDERDKKYLFNLGDLGGDISLKPELLEFMRTVEWSYMTKFRESIINISLYVNGKLRTSEAVVLDQNLDLYAAEELNLSDIHHVRMSLITNPDVLNPVVRTRWKQHPAIVDKILKVINDTLPGHVNAKDIKHNRLTFEDRIKFGQDETTARNIVKNYPNNKPRFRIGRSIYDANPDASTSDVDGTADGDDPTVTDEPSVVTDVVNPVITTPTGVKLATTDLGYRISMGLVQSFFVTTSRKES